MRLVVWTVWAILFVLLFSFAVSNTAVAELHFLLGLSWRAPLIALLLLFFLVGVGFGLMAMLPHWYRQRNEIRRLNQQLAARTNNIGAAAASGESVTFQSLAQSARITN